jgi:hypothetical protein
LQSIPEEDVKALVDYQLKAAVAARPPWWRDNQPRHLAAGKRGTEVENGLKQADCSSKQVTSCSALFDPHGFALVDR